jgi:hypothetical protein
MSLPDTTCVYFSAWFPLRVRHLSRCCTRFTTPSQKLAASPFNRFAVSLTSSASVYLWAFLEPSSTNSSVWELNCDSLVEDRKLHEDHRYWIACFHKQILGDDRRVSRSCFIEHICPFTIKQTPLAHTPVIHDTFAIHFHKLAMNFGRANVFRFQKLNCRTHLTVGGISDWRDSL